MDEPVNTFKVALKRNGVLSWDGEFSPANMKTEEEKIAVCRDELHHWHYELANIIESANDEQKIAEFETARRGMKIAFESLGRARWGEKTSPPLRPQGA